MIDFWFVEWTLPQLDTVANWATITLGAVAIVFAVNNYLWFALWRAIGALTTSWPIAVNVTQPTLWFERPGNNRPIEVNIVFNLTVAPARSAWNPRRPIEITGITVEYGPLERDVHFRTIADYSNVDRPSQPRQLQASIPWINLTTDQRLALLTRPRFQLVVSTTQTPRATRRCKATFRPTVGVAEGKFTIKQMKRVFAEANE